MARWHAWSLRLYLDRFEQVYQPICTARAKRAGRRNCVTVTAPCARHTFQRQRPWPARRMPARAPGSAASDALIENLALGARGRGKVLMADSRLRSSRQKPPADALCPARLSYWRNVPEFRPLDD